MVLERFKFIVTHGENRLTADASVDQMSEIVDNRKVLHEMKKERQYLGGRCGYR